MNKFFQELQRRNVIKATLSYIFISWALLQVGAIIFPILGVGDGAMRILLIALAIGFPIWFVFAYVFELTPSGFKKTSEVAPESSIHKSTGKRLNIFIMAGLSIAVVLLLVDRIFNLTGADDQSNDKSIAVLAFADMSPEKDQEYFSDGISEEILNLLAKIKDLKVISRTSSFSYKGENQNIQKIGEELNVGHILEGSIRKAGNTFRITTQLINVASGLHVWSETYDRDMDSIFQVQDEIAGTVTKQLKATLLGNELTSKTINPKAYNLFLQAKQLYRQGSYEAGIKALEFLKQSQEIDSTYAPAYYLKSRIIFRHTYSFMKIPYSEGLILCKTAALKAIDKDPDLFSGYMALASYNRVEWNRDSSRINIEKAMKLSPENSMVLVEASRNAMEVGHIEKAIELQKKAVVLDPLNYGGYYRLAMSYAWDEQYQQAETNLKKFILMNPNFPYAHGLMAEILLKLGRTEEVLDELEKETAPYWKLYRECMITFALTDKDESDLLLKNFINEYGDTAWSNIAEIYAYRGEKDEAFKWLELCLENRDAGLHEVLNYPSFKILHGDIRWNAFINRLDLPRDHGYHMD